MSDRLQGIVIGVILVWFCQLVSYVWRSLREQDHPPARNRDDETMKRHLDELYQDIDRGKLP
jgi:hypothetical protein